jgi:SAM-dependent methyltransferase
MTISATYDPADDKIRMRSATRLDAETYARVKAAGFGWAPKQGCFFAVWNPEREDLARELAGELEDEDTTLAERAEIRAERFAGYHEKRAEESKHAAEAVSAIADNIPLGQPILVGHHSERHARRDAERIESGMRKAVDLWKTAEYWQRRARGVLSHVEYKEQPEVRARRIKTLEADARKQTRTKDEAARFLRGWQRLTDPEAFKHKDGTPSTLLERAKYLANYDRGVTIGTWGKLDRGEMTPETAQAEAITTHQAQIASADRWLEHLNKRASKAALPLLNIRGKVTYREIFGSRGTIETETVDMTKADFAKIQPDYKGTRVAADGTHRLRLALLPGAEHHYTIVFLTDSKEHARPGQEEVAARASVEEEQKRQTATAYFARKRETRQRAAKASPPPAVAAVQNALASGGVQVAVAPQLFPTPRELARKMAYLADKCGLAGKRVLEPSAGTGNLVRAAIDSATGADNLRIVAVEINQALFEGLQHQRQLTVGATEDTFQIVWGNFLDYQPEGLRLDWLDLGYFHVVLMNPPFDHGVDIDHIKHAMQFLKPGGRLVAICANGPRQQAELKPLATTWEELPTDTFAASGTHVRTVLLTIDKG